MSTYESSVYEAPSASSGSCQPSCKGLFMCFGLVLLVGIIGMAGYSYFKYSKVQAEALKAKTAGSDQGAARRSQEARRAENGTTTLPGRGQVPAAGELCTVNEVVTPCSVDAAGRFVCVKSTTKGQCVDWSSQNRCLGGSGSRFRTLAGCEAVCRAEGPGGCRSPQACLCSGAFRATNYVFDGELQQCRLLPEHRCLDREQGFTDRRRCEETCRVGSGAGGQDGRCRARPVEGLLRQCRWSDQRFTFYYDASTKRCRRWGDGACVSGAHALLQDCLAHC